MKSNKSRNSRNRLRRGKAKRAQHDKSSQPHASSSSPTTAPRARRMHAHARISPPALAVFFVCLFAYVLNGDFMYGNDQKSNMVFGANLLENYSLSVTPLQAPEVFYWEWPPGSEKWIRVTEWNAQSQPLRERYLAGQAEPLPLYSFIESKQPGRYISAFGAGAAISLAPMYALLNLFTDVGKNRVAWWYGAKMMSSLMIALSAVLVFLSVQLFASRNIAFFAGIAFGLGTVAWSVSSQAFWQQTPHVFFIALGVWCFLIAALQSRRDFAAVCGAAIGMAVLVRPTGLFLALCLGAYFIFAARRLTLMYVLGALPFAIIAIWYNTHYLGDPFTFAQSIAADEIIERSKGDDVTAFGTSMFAGLGGLLASPSRGLLFFSPLLLLGFAGAALAWRDRARYATFIPLQVAALAMLLLPAAWYDWHGGATFGPRLLAEAGVLFTVLSAPALIALFAIPWARALCIIALAYSIFVHGLGAFAYNGDSWNHKDGKIPQSDNRLWSLHDSQILYYMYNFDFGRRTKKQMMGGVLNQPAPLLQ